MPAGHGRIAPWTCHATEIHDLHLRGRLEAVRPSLSAPRPRCPRWSRLGLWSLTGMLKHRNRHIVLVHEGLLVRLRAWRRCSVGDIGGNSSGIHEIGKFAEAGSIGDRRLGLPGVSSHDVDQFTEHGNLQLQLDAVDHPFQGRLDDVQIQKLHHEEADVHYDDQQVDAEELIHDLAAACFWTDLEQPDRLADVDSRENELLQAEAGHLDLLHHVIADDKAVVGTIKIRSVGDDGGRDVEADSIHDDHVLHSLEDFLIPGDQMQPRKQDDRLTGHHRIPSHRQQGHG